MQHYFSSLIIRLAIHTVQYNLAILLTNVQHLAIPLQELTDAVSDNKGSESLVAALHLVWAVGVNVCATTYAATHLDQTLAEEEMLLDWTFKHSGLEFFNNTLIKSENFFKEVLSLFYLITI